jgi:hypothetical protein
MNLICSALVEFLHALRAGVQLFWQTVGPNPVFLFVRCAPPSIAQECSADQISATNRLIKEETELALAIDAVPHARMPLMTVTLADNVAMKVTLSPHAEADIPAVRTSALLNGLFKQMPHARKILLVLKALMVPGNALSAVVGVHTGGISSFTMALLVLAFCKFQVRMSEFVQKVVVGDTTLCTAHSATSEVSKQLFAMVHISIQHLRCAHGCAHLNLSL